jgi:hypothetical protein
MVCATRLIAPSFFRFVMVIVSLGSPPKMRWIYANRIIASVANANPSWNHTFVNPEANPVRPISRFEKPSHSVVATFPARPNPTLSKVWHVGWYGAVFIHLRPKIMQLARREVDRVLNFGDSLFSGIHNACCEFRYAISVISLTAMADLFSHNTKEIQP